MRRLALALSIAALLAGCGGDDEQDDAASTQTTPTRQAPPAETATTATTDTTDTAASPTDEGPTINRADARLAGLGPAGRAAESVPDSELYFLDPEDVTCQAPGADDPSNLNQRAPEWTCEVESETNGVRCSGSYTVQATPAEDGRVTQEDISCESA